ncbi:MAG: DNA primase [Gammaproteobacteria bacterium CG11_big_fil_rev_8_21_14_0_20_46_22]|nr:MAG: DNA primase [Gammaproteobacteria bacterium CG12_big_fil_rev_8_21_14_0_65_46_12]PIR10277.1 MAG: DNA primase [Gammaproteobacteria bacterium CG11_big_fil_rev_8_21_14_0_20_46_22]
MAGKIPQHFIDDLLARTDIVSLVERYIPLKKAGTNYLCVCPFHDDHKPSMHVVPNKQFYYCFSCGASGNAIGFLMNYEHLSFIDAIETLASDAGIPVPREASQAQDRLQPLYDLLGKVSQYFQSELKNDAGQAARDYLKRRGLSQETIEHFSLGFAPDSWDSVTQRFGHNTEGQTALLQTGLIIEKNAKRHYDRFRNRVMFPIRDQRGRHIGFGGRVMDDSTPKYLNSPETPVFHKGRELFGLYEAKKTRDLNTLLVTEGYMDVIALHEAGITYAVATLGTAVTKDHIERLVRTVKHIVFCFDGDMAGRKAAWKALTTALPMLDDTVQFQFLFLPQGQDPDSFVREHGKTVFEQHIQGAHTLSQYLLEALSDDLNLETLEGRAQLVAKAMPLISSVKGLAIKEQLLQALAERSHTPKQTLLEWTDRAVPTASQAMPSHPIPADIKQTPVRFAITLLLQHPELLKETEVELPDLPMKGLDILKKIVEIIRNSSYITSATIVEHFRHDKAFTFLTKLAVAPLLIPEGSLQQELSDTLHTIKAQTLNFSIDTLLHKAKSQDLSTEEKQALQKLLVLKKTRHKTSI